MTLQIFHHDETLYTSFKNIEKNVAFSTGIPIESVERSRSNYQCAQIGISIQDSWPQELLKFFCYPKFSIALHTVNFIEWTHYRTYCWTSQRLMSGHRCTPPRPRRISVAQRNPLNRAGWKRMEAHSLTLSIIYLRSMTVCLSLIITMLITLIPLLCLLIAG